MDMDPNVLAALDRYFDAVPRSATRTEEIGPFTLFINDGQGWRYYARPRPGEADFEPGDVSAVIERQRELLQPRRFEWITDVSPGVGPAATAAGLTVQDRPLMQLRQDAFTPVEPQGDVEVRLVDPDEDLATHTAVATIGFGEPGTGVGATGTQALPAAASDLNRDTLGFARGRMLSGRSIMASAIVGGSPVATGSHQPVDGVTEITGVACLPAYRRRGLAAAVTSALVRDAFERGVLVVCLSAGDDEIARVYARVGFRRVGCVGEAGPDHRARDARIR